MTHEFEHSMGEPTQTGWPALAHVADAGYVHSLGAHMTCTAQRAPPDPRGRKGQALRNFNTDVPLDYMNPALPMSVRSPNNSDAEGPRTKETIHDGQTQDSC